MSQEIIPLGLVVTDNLFGMTIIAEDDYVATIYAILETGEISFPRGDRVLSLEKGSFLFRYEQERVDDMFQMFEKALSGDTLVELVKRYREKTLPSVLEQL